MQKGPRLANYRKTHLFGDLDNSMFRASDADSAVVELGGWRVGMLICYDVDFPITVRPQGFRVLLALRVVRLIASADWRAGSAPLRARIDRFISDDALRRVVALGGRRQGWAVSAEKTAVTWRPPSSRYRPMAPLLGSHWW
jgi:hypothetical protein